MIFLLQQELAGFYRDADVALITPMRDGMNLVAKEYVACRINEPGVLILSPFAGAGGMMHEVNKQKSLLKGSQKMDFLLTGTFG